MSKEATRSAVAAALLLFAGCGNPPALYGDAPQFSSQGADMGGSTGGGPPSCTNIVGDRKTQVCLRWNCDRMNRDEGKLDGDVGSCSAGTPAPLTIANTLKMVNLYRFIADLPPVTNDPMRGAKAQECSLMMAANMSLSHMPPMSWKCWTQNGFDAAGKSNIATTSAVQAIDLYMQDFGANNSTSIGHRRWLLSNSLGPVGVGTAQGGSCIWVIEGSGHADKKWTAWPSPGPVPIGAWQPGLGDGIDKTGWTIQSDSIDLSMADVTVKRDGKDDLMVTTTQLGAGYGSMFAIRFNPQGWTAEAGHSYHVSVAGTSTMIEYDVQAEGCPYP
jgi:hypothetical protein